MNKDKYMEIEYDVKSNKNIRGINASKFCDK